MRTLLQIVVLSFLVISCKTDPNTNASPLAAVQKDPNAENLKSYFSEIDQYIVDNRENSGSLKGKLLEAANIAMDNNLSGKASTYFLSLLRLDQNKDSRRPYLGKLAVCLNELKSTHAAKVLFKSYKDTYDDSGEFNSLDYLLDDEVSDLDAYMVKSTDAMFDNPDQYGLNKANAQKFVDIAEAFALGNPHSPDAPAHLYKAAETARSIRTLPKALNIYDWIMKDFPNYPKTPTVLFLKGFVIENELNNDEEAKVIYESFLNKYPDHEMAQSVKFLLENLGKSDEEILEIIEKKGKK